MLPQRGSAPVAAGPVRGRVGGSRPTRRRAGRRRCSRSSPATWGWTSTTSPRSGWRRSTCATTSARATPGRRRDRSATSGRAELDLMARLAGMELEHRVGGLVRCAVRPRVDHARVGRRKRRSHVHRSGDQSERGTGVVPAALTSRSTAVDRDRDLPPHLAARRDRAAAHDLPDHVEARRTRRPTTADPGAPRRSPRSVPLMLDTGTRTRIRSAVGPPGSATSSTRSPDGSPGRSNIAARTLATLVRPRAIGNRRGRASWAVRPPDARWSDRSATRPGPPPTPSAAPTDRLARRRRGHGRGVPRNRLECHRSGFRAVARHPQRTSARTAPGRGPDAARPRRERRARRPVRGPGPGGGISGAQLVVLTEAGHVCNMEAPAEFNDAVRTSTPRSPDQRAAACSRRYRCMPPYASAAGRNCFATFVTAL